MTTALVFQQLSKSTSIYQPPPSLATSNPTNAKHPTTILICGFMAGTPRNLSRYTAKYNSLFPAARIILVTSVLADAPGFRGLLSSSELKERAEVPVRALLAGRINGEERLLAHVFSNGGGMKLGAIIKAYAQMTNGPLPAKAIVFDSTPGGDRWTNEFSRWVNAITIGLPSNPFIQFLGKFSVALLVIVLLVIPSLFGVENAATKTRREINDPKLISLKAKRLYIYSDSDALIGAKEVQEYADESAEKGWDVESVNFGSSGHVRHAIVDPERYWKAVLKAWESSLA